MSEVLIVVAIAFLWSFLAGNLSVYNLCIGALLGLALLAILRRQERFSFPRRVLASLSFFFHFLYELVLANIAVVKLAFAPRPRLSPHIVAVPLSLKSDAAITLLAATITLLPGTVAMGVSEDRGLLYAHAIGEADIEASRESILRIERLILKFMT